MPLRLLLEQIVVIAVTYIDEQRSEYFLLLLLEALAAHLDEEASHQVGQG
jgi:hypothetical protein